MPERDYFKGLRRQGGGVLARTAIQTIFTQKLEKVERVPMAETHNPMIMGSSPAADTVRRVTKAVGAK